jgi:hypothetical protein
MSNPTAWLINSYINKLTRPRMPTDTKKLSKAFSGYATAEACFANLSHWTIPSRFTFILFSLRR